METRREDATGRSEHRRTKSSSIRKLGSRAAPAPEGRISYAAIDIGTLQVTDNWATVTARARVVEERTLERNIVIVVEGADPWPSGKPPSITMWEEGKPAPMTVRLQPGMVSIQ